MFYTSKSMSEAEAIERVEGYMRAFGFDPTQNPAGYDARWRAFRRRRELGVSASIEGWRLNATVGRRIFEQTGVITSVSFCIMHDNVCMVAIL